MRIRMKIKHSLLFGSVMLMIISGCTEQNSTAPAETPKDIEGSWGIVEASRNGEDITDKMDFSQFKLQFSDNQTYSIENALPFMVRQNGGWSLDDPQYPFKITFDPENSEPLVTDFNYPTVEGTRQIILTFSSGCSGNSYEYVLERTTE